MMPPAPPQWFVKELTNISPSLVCTFAGVNKGWRISQLRKVTQELGYCDSLGGRLSIIKLQPFKILDIPYIGSRAFQDIKMADSRHWRSYEEFCKNYKIAFDAKSSGKKTIQEMLYES